MVTSSMMKLSQGSTCGEDCFRLVDETADVFMVKTFNHSLIVIS